MQQDIVSRFFEPIKPVVFDDEPDYSLLDNVSSLLNAMGDIVSHNSYVIDYYRKNLFFVSQNSLFLCGYTQEEVLESGYHFYEKILSPEDLNKLAEINDVGFKKFYEMPIEQRLDASISYDLLLHRKDGTTLSVNHRLKPYLFTPNGNLWLSVCCLRHSLNDKMGNVILYFNRINKRYEYSFTTKTWTELPSLFLTNNERMLVLESYRATPDKQIADILNVSINTVSYYKKRIMEKTGTTKIKEAVNVLFSMGII